ncbi:hypothetical protein [Oceanicoccus sp. KOV_DT_Chl]|uniref:hypothetical protein n=1 Tax=Oceanicoccus sp. KOV_DT_Chl TaxID=1904639 RepID=UPI000C7CBEBD|nr:hypothetical protein [Oceanicoccus sp. KOV_DT_Chl]
MEKLLYPVWKKESQSIAEFRQLLLGSVSEKLLASGVLKLRWSIIDEDVEPAKGLRQQNIQPSMDAMLTLWLDSSVFRAEQETIIAAAVETFHGYLVTESESIVNTKHPAVEGQRTYGMNEVVFLQRPERLTYEQWLDIWHNSHTQIAIDTQSTFGYRQNVVTRKLTEAGPEIAAIIEENFPPEAMTSQHAFYDAYTEDGDEDDARKDANLKAMIDSVVRFIDFDKIDVMPTSEYLIKA